MKLSEKLNSLSLEELQTIQKAIKTQKVGDHPPLYGVSFNEWAEAVNSEIKYRTLME